MVKLCPVMSRPVTVVVKHLHPIEEYHTELHKVGCDQEECALWNEKLGKCGLIPQHVVLTMPEPVVINNG